MLKLAIKIMGAFWSANTVYTRDQVMFCDIMFVFQIRPFYKIACMKCHLIRDIEASNANVAF